MARDYENYLNRGATIAALVIDTPGQNAAMVEKLLLPFPVLSDPTGDEAIKPFNLWNAKGSMAIPAVLLLAPGGKEVYRYAGIDFMDRPVEAEVITALDQLALPPIVEAISTVSFMTPEAGPRAMNLPDLAVYMRGVRSSSNALAGSLKNDWDRQEAARTTQMAGRYIAAQAATVRMHDRTDQ